MLYILFLNTECNSPFPRYFKRKGDRETLAPERCYGKYTSNVADDAWLCMPAKTSYGGSLKLVRGLKTTGRKQEVIDRAIKAKVDGTETIEERETREKNALALRLLKNCAVHLRIFQILKL